MPNETPDLATLIQQIRDVLAPYDLLSAPDDAMSDDDAMASSLYIVGQGFSSLPGSVPVKLQKLMRQYKSSEPDFRPYAYFPSLESGQGTPACAKYTRNLVDRGNGEYNLLVLCWPEGSSSQIHDHPGAHCIVRRSLACESADCSQVAFRVQVKMLSGRLQEKRYKRETKGEALKLVTERVLETDQVCYMHGKPALSSAAVHCLTSPLASGQTNSASTACTTTTLPLPPARPSRSTSTRPRSRSATSLT